MIRNAKLDRISPSHVELSPPACGQSQECRSKRMRGGAVSDRKRRKMTMSVLRAVLGVKDDENMQRRVIRKEEKRGGKCIYRMRAFRTGQTRMASPSSTSEATTARVEAFRKRVALSRPCSWTGDPLAGCMHRACGRLHSPLRVPAPSLPDHPSSSSEAASTPHHHRRY